MDSFLSTRITEESPIIDAQYSFEEAIRGTRAPDAILGRLRLVTVRYYGFDGRLRQGQLVVHEAIAEEIKAIFDEIKESKFPVAKVIPIVKYEWDDERSIADNNASAFNYRPIMGETDRLSAHAYGAAIDINPMENPYIKNGDALPKGAKYDTAKSGTIHRDSLPYILFTKNEWQWGGDWKSLKDYQHFEKPSVINAT